MSEAEKGESVREVTCSICPEPESKVRKPTNLFDKITVSFLQ